jgi:hypothetical protein
LGQDGCFDRRLIAQPRAAIYNYSAPVKADLDWLVPMRSKIQALGLEIYRFDLALKPQERAKLWPIQGLCIGIIFSLWRAVFISLPERSPHSMYEHGQEILKIVLDTNTVGFVQERMTQQWMAGYYNNNAFLRLSRYCEEPKLIRLWKSIAGDEGVAVLRKFHISEQGVFGSMSPKDQCIAVFDWVQAAFGLLQRAAPKVARGGSR